MAEKVTVMILKVDLQCPCCYKKVKKILCKFPQIRDQVYNEKANTVKITVVCCNPEKLRDKLCCKGGKVIRSIEIVVPKVDPPKEDKKPQEIPKVDPPKPDNKPQGVPKVDPPKEDKKPQEITKKDPPKPDNKPQEIPKKDPQKPPPPPPPDPTKGPGPMYPPDFPPRTCCGPCSEGYGGGPCYFGFGPPPPPPRPCYDGYGGCGCHDRPCHVIRCDYYFCEENPQSCSIM